MSGPTPYAGDGKELFTEERPAVVILGDLLKYIEEMRDVYDNVVDLEKELTNKIDNFDRSLLQDGLTLSTTIAKLSTGNTKPKIGIIGDSLAEPAGTGIKWTQLLFDSVYKSNGYYLGDIFPNTPNIDQIDNYAVGGQTSHFSMAFIAPEVYPLKKGLYQNQTINGEPKNIAPIFSKKYDLMIISYGANGGEHQESFLEILIKQLRLTGTEVILLTANPRSDNLNFGFSSSYKKLAKSYSTGIADTQSYFKRELDKGVSISSLLADTIHSSQNGQNLYAESIKDLMILNKKLFDEKQYPNAFISEKRVKSLIISGDTKNTVFPSMPMVQFIPSEHNGTLVNATQSNQLKNPIFGRYDDMSNKSIKLEAGQVANFNSSLFRGFGVIFANHVNCNYEIRLQNGSSLLTSSSVSAGAGRAEFRNFDISLLGLDSYQNRSIQIKCTSGTMYLLGIVFYGYGFKQLPLKKKNGVFIDENLYNIPSYSTDTINDSIEFQCESNGFSLEFFNHNASGIVDIYLDNIKIETVDLYTTLDDNVHTVTKMGIGYGKHNIKIVLVGFNQNAVTPSGVKHRLSVFSSSKQTFDNDFSMKKL